MRALRMVCGFGIVLAAVAGCTSATSGIGHGPSPLATTLPGTETASPTPTPTTPTPSPPTSFATLFERQSSGVVRIETVGCSDSGVGTGFLLSPTQVLTVAHVVDESLVVSLVDGKQRTTGTVVGIDRSRDVALVRADDPFSGYHFQLASTLPRIGDEVAAIGFPIGDPITLTRGNISGLDRKITVNGQPRSGLIETDTAINPGNSGGPLIDDSGIVVGLIDAKNVEATGIGYAVPATQAAENVHSWGAGTPQPPASCPRPLGPPGAITVPAPNGLDPADADGISAAFNTYFNGINTGDYAAAWNVFSPRHRAEGSLESFAEGVSTSYDSDIRVLSARRIDANTVGVVLTFTSLQSPDKGPDGDVCDIWTLDYRMIQGAGGRWFIDHAFAVGGRTHVTC